MKKLLLLAVLLLAICTRHEMIAASNGFNIDKNEFLQYYGKAKVVTIPSNINKIGYEAFSGNTTVEKVIIPKSVKEIDTRAFYQCKNLKTVVWAEGTKTVGLQAFSGCKKLSKITIPSTVNYCGSSVLEETLWIKNRKSKDYIVNNHILVDYKGKDTELVIPKNVLVIAEEVFSSNKKIKSVDLNKVKILCDGAFLSCIKLNNIVMSEQLVSIGNYAFNGCSIKEVEIPKTVKNIESTAFGECRDLETVVFRSKKTCVDSNAFEFSPWEETLRYDGDYLFVNSTIKKYKGSTVNLELPEGITGIGYQAFNGNKKLKTIKMPKSMKHIESHAFSGCKNLKSITLNQGLEYIDSFVFADTSIKKITLPGTMKSVEFRSFEFNDALETIVMEEGITKIDGEMPYGFKGLKKVYIPKSIKVLPYFFNGGNSNTITFYCKRNYVNFKSMSSENKKHYKIKLIK